MSIHSLSLPFPSPFPLLSLPFPPSSDGSGRGERGERGEKGDRRRDEGGGGATGATGATARGDFLRARAKAGRLEQAAVDLLQRYVDIHLSGGRAPIATYEVVGGVSIDFCAAINRSEDILFGQVYEAFCHAGKGLRLDLYYIKWF